MSFPLPPKPRPNTVFFVTLHSKFRRIAPTARGRAGPAGRAWPPGLARMGGGGAEEPDTATTCYITVLGSTASLLGQLIRTIE